MNFPNPGDTVDILNLLDLRREQHINVYLYMDAEIARTSTVEEDIRKYRLIDLDFRPVLEIEDWFKFMKKQMKQIAGDAVPLEEMLKSEPLNAEILDTGTIQTPAGTRPYLKCLLPYLDEMDEIEVKKASELKQK
ncbi:MAG TPA: hypothetical protein O0X27_01395 [Methanocorpusculum sp.]|nr:hypothetical protein [Methanocorpusculum sp.]